MRTVEWRALICMNVPFADIAHYCVIDLSGTASQAPSTILSIGISLIICIYLSGTEAKAPITIVSIK